MTVAAAVAKAGPYTGNDVTTTFAFSFKVFADADIRVVQTIIASGLESDLVLNTDYTVSRNADQDANPGGSVTYVVATVATPYPSTKKLTIVGDFDYEQPTDIPNGGSFFAQTVENALDRITLLVKQLKEVSVRSLTLGVSSAASTQLPAPVASNLIGWSSDGTQLENYTALTGATSVSAFAATLLDDTTAAIARTTLGAVGLTGNETIAGDKTLSGNNTHSGNNTITKPLIFSGAGLGNVPNVPILNGYVEWSIAANALTCSIKTLAGTDPSATDPVYARFRDPTLTTAGYYIRTITAALSVVVSSGSTLGTISAEASRIRAVLVDNAGTVELGVYNSWNGTTTHLLALDESGVYSTTAEGGAGAADAAHTIYTTTARTGKAIAEVGYVESTQTTAGTWAQALDKKVTAGVGYRRTGDQVQMITAAYSTQASSSSSAYADTGLTATITPRSAANKVLVQANQAGLAKTAGNTALQLKLLMAGAQIALMEGEAANTGSAASNYVGGSSCAILSNPNAATATIYKTQFASSANVASVYTQVSSSTSTLLLTEVFA